MGKTDAPFDAHDRRRYKQTRLADIHAAVVTCPFEHDLLCTRQRRCHEGRIANPKTNVRKDVHLAGRADPHLGHGAGSDISLAHLNASNLLRHFLHSYSYTGTFLFLSDSRTVDVVRPHQTISPLSQMVCSLLLAFGLSSHGPMTSGNPCTSCHCHTSIARSCLDLCHEPCDCRCS